MGLAANHLGSTMGPNGLLADPRRDPFCEVEGGRREPREEPAELTPVAIQSGMCQEAGGERGQKALGAQPLDGPQRAGRKRQFFLYEHPPLKD